LPSVEQLEAWLRESGKVIHDGDDEHDNVPHTNHQYVRVDALAALTRVANAVPAAMVAEPARVSLREEILGTLRNADRLR
jgi:hypothetical protein